VVVGRRAAGGRTVEDESGVKKNRRGEASRETVYYGFSRRFSLTSFLDVVKVHYAV
jgi:hypothetical protein